MEPNKKHIYFLCPGVQWNKPTTGGLLYNSVVIDTLKKKYGNEAVTPLNLIGNTQEHSWLRHRIITNLKYLKFFIGKKVGKSDLILVDSRSNSLLILPFLFLHFFSKATIGMMVYHINYYLSGRHGVAGKVESYCEKLFIRCASFIITISQSTLRGITQLTGRSEFGKIPIWIVPPGLEMKMVPVERLKGDIKKFSEITLLYVGTCEDPRKGLDYLIDAIADLNFSHFKLYLVGKYNKMCTYHRRLSKSIQDYDLSAKVFFLGRVSEENLHQLYQEANIFVFPSLWEGYGIVLAEAMAHGLPIVATDVSSIPEIVSNGENGILVPPGNSEALAEAISELVGNEDLRREMSQKSIEIARTFKGWDEVSQDIVQCIEKSFASKFEMEGH